MFRKQKFYQCKIEREIVNFFVLLLRIKGRNTGIQVVNPLFSVVYFILSSFLYRYDDRLFQGSSSRLVGIQTIYANNGTTEVLGCTVSSVNIPVSWRLTRRSLSFSLSSGFQSVFLSFIFLAFFLWFRNYHRGHSSYSVNCARVYIISRDYLIM